MYVCEVGECVCVRVQACVSVHVLCAGQVIGTGEQEYCSARGMGQCVEVCG